MNDPILCSIFNIEFFGLVISSRTNFPPGFKTLYISPSALSVSDIFLQTKLQNILSKLLSSKGNFSAVPRTLSSNIFNSNIFLSGSKAVVT